jgi:hypothetical protein
MKFGTMLAQKGIDICFINQKGKFVSGSVGGTFYKKAEAYTMAMLKERDPALYKKAGVSSKFKADYIKSFEKEMVSLAKKANSSVDSPRPKIS